MVKNPLLKFTVEEMLRQANPTGDVYFRTTHFNKLLFIVYKRLLKRGIDIKLPYCWYRFGTLVDANTFRHEVGTPLPTYAPYNSQTISIRGVDDMGIHVSDRDEIVCEISDAIEIYKSSLYMFNLEKLKEDDYSYAPLVFQKTFNRGFVIKVESGNLGPRDTINEGLDDLVRTFPYDEMPELNDAFLEWEDTIRLVLEFDSTLLPTLTSEFFKTFCYLLRAKYNENVAAEVIQYWNNEFLAELSDYCEVLEKNRDNFLDKYSKICKKEGSAQPIIDEMNRVAFMLSTVE